MDDSRGNPQTEKQRNRMAEELEERREEAQAKAGEDQLMDDAREPDDLDPRAKSTGHGKKTADKWNQ
jgi:hypothetical protein